jgi:hypothetical protein
MVTRSADLVVIGDSEAELREVLADLGLPEGPLPDLDRLRAALGELRDHPANRGEVGASAVIGRYHFPLRRTLYAALVATVKSAGAVVAALANPTAGGIAAALVILDTIEKAAALISRLDEREILALEALASATARNQARDPQADSASLDEVAAVLTEQDEAVPDLANILHAMSDPGGRRGIRRIERDGLTRYTVIY